MLERSITIPPQSRSFTFTRESLNEDTRTVDVVFSTETEEVERSFGVEILDHSPGSVKLDRLRNKAALLMYHDRKDQVGVVENARIEGRQGVATVRFSRSARGEEIYQDVLDGIRTKISVGYQITCATAEGKRSDGTPVYRVGWAPFEISMESIPADDDAGVRSESIFGQRTAELSTQIIMDNQTEPQERALENDIVTPVAPLAVEQDQRSLAPVAKPISENEINRLADVRAAEEIDRRENLAELARAFNVPDKDLKEAVRNKVSVDAFKVSLVDQKRLENPAMSAARLNENTAQAEPGTRAHTMTVWAESAKVALGERGKALEVPNYTQITTIERNYVDSGSNQFHRSMAGSMTLADVAKLDAGIGSPVIDEVTTHSPEVAYFPVTVIDGATVELSVVTGAGTVGFRNANEGSLSVTGTFESRIFQTQVIEVPIVVDIQGVLNASKDPGRLLLNQASAVLKKVVSHIGTQTWYAGTAQSGADTKAAPGVIAQSSTASTHVVDADGSTALTSVWMVQLGEDSLGHIYGNGTSLNLGSSWMEETVEAASGYRLRALVNYISGRVAPRLANKNGAIRIKKVGTDSGKGLTDLLLYSAYQKASDIDMVPNAIFMNSRSLEQLRASRTATSISGEAAPLPDMWKGIPIYVTRNLSNAETV